MQATNIEIVMIVVFVALALAIWIIAAYSFVQMLRRTRQGHWSKLLFQYGWWNPNNVNQYLSPAGIPHYQRLIRAIGAFMIVILCGMVYVFMRIWISGF